MEVYRSGHNGPDSKSGSPHGLVGSNPTASGDMNSGRVKLCRSFYISYTMADSELFYDISNAEAGFVPYEGQEASYYAIAQWWENGEKTIMTECEYDPNM